MKLCSLTFVGHLTNDICMWSMYNMCVCCVFLSVCMCMCVFAGVCVWCVCLSVYILEFVANCIKNVVKKKSTAVSVSVFNFVHSI